MNDKKLNEVKKVTDMAYVPVIMADGSVGQIAKADLATVVAGVISPICYRAWTDEVDADTLSTGSIFCGNNCSNVPGDFCIITTMGTGDRVQFAISTQNSITYVRSYSGTWKPWSRCDNFGYNTLAELATALKPLLGLS